MCVCACVRACVSYPICLWLIMALLFPAGGSVPPVLYLMGAFIHGSVFSSSGIYSSVFRCFDES